MTGSRVREQYYYNRIYQEEDGSWHFLDERYKDHGPFTSYKVTCGAVDEYLAKRRED